ncbi:MULTISPECIES: NUDIX hydrolase [Deinococcus]|jgi:8-oxo-dGTP pyrophosphatase MutT (NUDIX family)|uniref:NUDIX hydrolase n=2 Tax=Deinococcus TaxID=1298 RepID=A0A221SUM9_9DEIO|nr:MULTISPECIES: NUDIX hydrolase [Deinococcus]ASN80342.1 NUDIX hydrolase [Deinococcus ficus]MDP9763712.1 8-oxo-dGTP pyrophosphatase MutT (NUDIX family) [Deinococcus enclensis]
MTRQTRTLPLKRAAHVYLVRDGKLLLVEERMDDGSIFYGLPGGKAQPGETLADAAARQVQEETGLQVSDLTFVSLLEGELLTGTKNECYAMFARFTATAQGEIAPTDPEVVGVKWVPFDQVEGLVRYGPPPECEERNPLIWLPTRDYLAGEARTYYPI